MLTPFPLAHETKIDDVPFFFDGSFEYQYRIPAASGSILGMYTDTYKPREGRGLGHMRATKTWHHVAGYQIGPSMLVK